MVMHPAEENPMWASLATITRDARGAAGEGELVCRIALPASEMRALVGDVVPTEHLTRFATWDPPQTLLADDAELAERLRAAGIAVVAPAASYGERQWDARDALEGALHRYHDHGETPWGMSAFEPDVAVVLVRGAPRILALLARLLKDIGRSGVVLDARDPRELRVFEIHSLDRDRIIVVFPDRSEEHRRDAGLDEVLRDLVYR